MTRSNRAPMRSYVHVNTTVPNTAVKPPRKSKGPGQKRKDFDADVMQKIKLMIGTSNIVQYVNKPIAKVVFESNDRMEHAHAECMLTQHGHVTPKTRSQAIAIDRQNGNNNWQTSMQKEYDTLVSRGTWKFVRKCDIPEGAKILPAVWAFKVKAEDGNWTQNKSRGNAGGHKQVKGVHYDESYSPTTNLISFRTVASIAAEQDFDMMHVDIDSAFLYGNIPDGLLLYMKPFEGFATFDTDGEPLYYLLVKGLYGLVQAALLFNNELVAHFISQGFHQSKTDACTFVKIKDDKHIIVPVHVDDLLPTGKPKSALIEFQDNLEKAFDIKRLGEAKWFSAMAICRTPGRIQLNNSAYMNDFVRAWAVEGTPNRRTPMDDGIDLFAMTKDDTYELYDPNKADGTSVRSYAGGYAWPTDCTRPDLAWSRMQFARLQQDCSVSSFEVMKQSVYHIQGTIDCGIAFYKGSEFPNQPVTFADSGFATCRFTRRSCYFIIVFLNGGPVYWKAKMIPGKTPSGNTFEAEIVPLYEAWRFLKYYYQYMTEIGFPPQLPLVVYGDNESALLFAKHARTTQDNRHIDVKYCILSAEYNAGFIDFRYVMSKANVADLGTKAQKCPMHYEFLASTCTAKRLPDA